MAIVMHDFLIKLYGGLFSSRLSCCYLFLSQGVDIFCFMVSYYLCSQNNTYFVCHNITLFLLYTQKLKPYGETDKVPKTIRNDIQELQKCFSG